MQGTAHRDVGSEDGVARKRERRVTPQRLLLVTGVLVGLTVLGVLRAGDIGRGGARLATGAAGALEHTVQNSRRALLNLFIGPPRVGVQVGHEEAQNHPEELAALRVNTGGHAAGVDEVDVNRAVAQELARRLEAHGVTVDVLPATPPEGYHADLFVSLHADASPDTARRGYKTAYFSPPRNRFEPRLKASLDAAYGASGLPDDNDNVTDSMFLYYAFNFRRYHHSVHPGTPAVIVELGYLSNPEDRGYLSRPDEPAARLEAGILTYLRERGRLE